MQKGLSKAAARAVITAAIGGATTNLWAVPQSVPFLSVDINGGQLYTDVGELGKLGQNLSTNLGWNGNGPDNGTANVPVLSPQLGTSLLWTPWGGHDGILVPANPNFGSPAFNTGGDGIQLPFETGIGGYPTLNNPITKTFTIPSGTATVRLTAGSGLTINSRDRGIGTGSPDAPQLPDNGTTNFANMYRDLIFVGRDTGLGLGSNPLVIQLSGLEANTTYEFTGFAFDPFSPGQHLWGAVAPQQFGYTDTIGATTPDNFMDPPAILRDAMVGVPVSWNRDPTNLQRSIAPVNEYAAASSFQVTTDANGNVTFYEWANSYHDGGQSQTVFNGFQIGSVASSRWNATSSANWGTGPWIGGVPNAIGAVANLGQISGPQTVTLESGKTVSVLTIASSNAYTIAGAALTFNGNSATHTVLEGAPPPVAVVKTFEGHAQLNVVGNHSISAPLVLADNTFVRVAGGSSLTVSGAISGIAALNKTGDGVLTLTGNSTNNSTSVYQGRLHLQGTSGGATFSVAGGGQLTGTGTVQAQTNVWNGGVIAPGPGTGPGIATLTFATLAFGSQNSTGGQVTLNIDLAAGNSSDKLVATSALGFSVNPDTLAVWDGTVLLNFNNTGAGVGSTFTLIDYNGAALADADNFLPSTPLLGNMQPVIINNTGNTSVDMNLVVPNAWNVDSSGNASVGANFTDNVSPNGIGQVVKYGAVITAPKTVTFDSPITYGGIVFDSAQSYTLDGPNAITMNVVAGNPIINVTAGNHTIAAPVILSDNTILGGTSATSTLVISGSVSQDSGLPANTNVGITKTGSGTASLTGVNTYNGPSTVQGGVLKMNEAAADRVFNGGGGVVNGGRLVLDYTGASPGTAVKNILAAGYAQATKFSTGAIRTTNATNGLIGLGWRDVGGLTTEVTVAYTYYGDSDLNGQVDVNDLGNLATSWQAAGVWAGGDFDYTGTVDVNDLGLLATNWQAGVGNPLGPSFAEAMASFGLPSASVPEPATIGLLGLIPWSLKRPGRRARRVV